MDTLKFKTTIKCGGCLIKAQNALELIDGIIEWNVDLESPQKTLTISTEKDIAQILIESLEEKDFEVEQIY